MVELALSVKQPWAFLIAHGLKPIENRTWSTRFRGRIYVHASQWADLEGSATAYRNLVRHVGIEEADRLWRQPERSWYGCIVGEVDIVDCVETSSSHWFVGPYGFILANPDPYVKPIRYRGRPGFFKVALP